jgi:flavin reductase (DIM6/NTAB) family NADH-FMN oxidoreductase RutF
MTNQDLSFPLEGADALKATFRLHASGVSVITLSSDTGNPLGFTATSVTSLGSNPPLVSFNVASGSSSYPSLVPGRTIAIHTLSADNLGLAQRMAGPASERFSAGDWKFQDQAPVFDCASAVLIGKIRQVIAVEANAVVVVDVIKGREFGESHSPLLYYRRGYLTSGERLADNF